MRDNRKYSVYPSDIDVVQGFRLVEKFLAECKMKEVACNCPNTRFNLKISETRDLNVETFSEFLKLLEQHRGGAIRLHSHWKKRLGSIVTVGIELIPSHLQVYIDADADEVSLIMGIHGKIQEIFQASNPMPEKSPSLERQNLKKSIFLAHRFDETGLDVARKLMRFLQGLGFYVLDGIGYEANSIPEKVKDRIRIQDIFICLATPGDFSWIISEMAHAGALSKYIVILCQEDVIFNAGIIGKDREYMRFPCGGIEKIYTDLLYALP